MGGLRDAEDGLTMIEIMVASTLLIVGMLGVLGLYSGAIRTTTTNNTRVAATNLARELIETAREVAYDDLAAITSQAQSRGLGSGTPWTIERRGVVYTVIATTCVFDSPTDGYAATAPGSACTSRPVGDDVNGEDFRRVSFSVSWQDDARVRTLSQSTLIINPSGGLGPRILTISPLTQTITANVSSVSVVWATTAAQSLIWEIDDGVSNGTVTGATNFTASWLIGTSGSGSEVFDGAYTMSGRAFDERDIPGETRSADIVLNRRTPYAPTGFSGGHNTRLGQWVEFEWALNRERDILGYRVVWAGPDSAFSTADDQQACPAPAVGTALSPTTSNCVHMTAQTGVQKYSIVALDRDAANNLRTGDARTLNVPASGSRPSSPLLLILLTVSGQPRLTWAAPLLTDVAFYRIYRDGTAVGYADRYDRTTGGLITTYTDTDHGGVSHRYWVTTVDSKFNESNPIGPVTWTP